MHRLVSSNQHLEFINDQFGFDQRHREFSSQKLLFDGGSVFALLEEDKGDSPVRVGVEGGHQQRVWLVGWYDEEMDIGSDSGTLLVIINCCFVCFWIHGGRRGY
eukprot:TRINITY_DN2680_c0_g1_i1.p2 TRINITY_DN2680_c0_g1~~TRINITY_DN2680_c0_g1_i1.p2  ORF type:complete len:104 (-),score=17.98 TRINITY_DN2680_c0_g1_i1:70-381(-)